MNWLHGQIMVAALEALREDIFDTRPRKKFRLRHTQEGPITGTKKREGKRAGRRRLAKSGGPRP